MVSTEQNNNRKQHNNPERNTVEQSNQPSKIAEKGYYTKAFKKDATEKKLLKLLKKEWESGDYSVID